MKIMIKDLKPNEQVTTYFALESLKLRKSKNQRNFLELILQDRTGKIKGYLWDNPVITAAVLKEKTVIKIRSITTLLNDSLILAVEKVRQANKNETDIRDFLEVVNGGVELWREKLLEPVDLIREFNCRRLVDSFLNDSGFLELFITSPAGVSVHHNYIGGLLEHTTTIMAQAAQMADRYPSLLDKDLLLTGAFLHDIGKTRELYWELAKEYTTEGKLLGHITIGILLLEEKIAELADFPADLALMLRHMILSHHGEIAFGSLVRPAIPEAIALNILDKSDARINHLCSHLSYSNPDESWSQFDKILNTQIYQKKYLKSQFKQLEVTQI